MLVMFLNQSLDSNPHILCKLFAIFIELHDTTARVVLAMPKDFIRCSLVEAKAKGRFVLPHLTCHVVTTTKLIGKTLAICIEDETTYTPQGLCRQEFDFGIRVVWFYKPRRVNLHPLQVNGLRANCLAHLDAISSAMLTISSR